MRRGPGLLVLLGFAGCSPAGQADPLPQAQPASPSASPASAPAHRPAQAQVTDRTVLYSRLDRCKVVRESREEMPFTETRCSGPAGWALTIADADARQSITLVAPDGRQTRLDTAAIGGGGFSSFGNLAEWRGSARGGFSPDTLIVRYQVAEEPHPAPETSYLLVVPLEPEPCLTARIAPGPDQNARARAAADRGGACADD